MKSITGPTTTTTTSSTRLRSPTSRMNEGGDRMSLRKMPDLRVGAAVILIAAVSALVFSNAPGGSAGPTRASDDLVIEGGTLIDGTGGRPIENSIVVIRGNRILLA